MARIEITVDGTRFVDDVEPRLLLVQYLREHLGRTGTVIGCDTSNCGACTVLLTDPDGVPRAVKSCAVLAVQADGRAVTTIEGLGGDHPVQRAFHTHHALQCGFCTPGMIMAAVDLLRDDPDPDEAAVRDGLGGNLCRCTGYQNIVRAVLAAARERAGAAEAGNGARSAGTGSGGTGGTGSGGTDGGAAAARTGVPDTERAEVPA